MLSLAHVPIKVCVRLLGEFSTPLFCLLLIFSCPRNPAESYHQRYACQKVISICLRLGLHNLKPE